MTEIYLPTYQTTLSSRTALSRDFCSEISSCSLSIQPDRIKGEDLLLYFCVWSERIGRQCLSTHRHVILIPPSLWSAWVLSQLVLSFFWDVLITSIQFLQKCHQQTREGLDFRFLRKALETTLLDKTLTMSTEALLVFLVPHFGWSTPFHSCTDSWPLQIIIIIFFKTWFWNSNRTPSFTNTPFWTAVKNTSSLESVR